MTRSIEEIATDLKAAVTVIATTNAQMAETMTGNPVANRTPPIEVRLDDGRVVELGALADELLATASLSKNG
jgi:hypothetical protein